MFMNPLAPVPVNPQSSGVQIPPVQNAQEQPLQAQKIGQQPKNEQKQDKKLATGEVEKKLRDIFSKLSLTKPDDKKFEAIRNFLESDGQGYLLESQLENCIKQAFGKLSAEYQENSNEEKRQN